MDPCNFTIVPKGAKQIQNRMPAIGGKAQGSGHWKTKDLQLELSPDARTIATLSLRNCGPSPPPPPLQLWQRSRGTAAPQATGSRSTAPPWRDLPDRPPCSDTATEGRARPPAARPRPHQARLAAGHCHGGPRQASGRRTPATSSSPRRAAAAAALPCPRSTAEYNQIHAI